MTIDVHAHFVPPTVIETLVDRGAEFGIDLVESEPGCHCCRFSSGIQIRPFFDELTDVSMRLEKWRKLVSSTKFYQCGQIYLAMKCQLIKGLLGTG